MTFYFEESRRDFGGQSRFWSRRLATEFQEVHKFCWQPPFLECLKIGPNVFDRVALRLSLGKWCWELSCLRARAETCVWKRAHRSPWSFLDGLLKSLCSNQVPLRATPCLLLEKVAAVCPRFAGEESHRKICLWLQFIGTCKDSEVSGSNYHSWK